MYFTLKYISLCLIYLYRLSEAVVWDNFKMSESQFSLTHLIGAAAVGLLAGATLVKLSQKPKKKNLLHIVGLKFNEALTEEEIQRHFKEEAKLKVCIIVYMLLI